MYADQISTGRKRSIRERLDGDLAVDIGSSRQYNSKRQRTADDKWKHDLYHEEKQQHPKTMDPRDLREKLQKRGTQQANAGKAAVRDLRDKLSGTMHAQPLNLDRPKVKAASVVSAVLKSEATVPAAETKVVPKSSSSKKVSQKKSESSVDAFLRSLGLEKYSLTFQAEEVDMTALKHMTDGDLKALGVPMGPRKKILLALPSRA